MIGPRAVLAAGAAGLLLPAGAACAWDLDARLGVEVESFHESFSLPDTVAAAVHDTPGGDFEAPLTSLRFREEETQTDGLLRLALRHTGSPWELNALGRVTTGSGRTRETLDLELTRASSALGRLRLQEFFYGQSGGEESQDGFQNEISFDWNPPVGSEDWNWRWRGRWDLSRSWGDSLGRIFNYDRARIGTRVGTSWGWGRSAGLEAQWTGKWVRRDAAGSYDAVEVRADADWDWGDRMPVSLQYGVARRDYDDAGNLTDSYWEQALDLFASRRLDPSWSTETRWGLRGIDYDGSGSVFQDTRSVEGRLLVERRLGSDWAVKAGPGGGLLWERGGGGSYRTGRFRLEVSYEPLGSFWWHAGGDVGRRDYAEDVEAELLVFEGYNLSLTRSDYTFASLSLLGEAEIGWGGLAVEIFLQHDVERHAVPEDDVSLTLWTMRITRRL